MGIALSAVIVGLASLVQALVLPEQARCQIFMRGRAVGWRAHLVEQSCAGMLIRPHERGIDDQLN